MFQNREVPAQDQDGIITLTSKHEQQIQQQELNCKSNDLAKWSFKITSLTINGQKIVEYCSEDSNKAKNSTHKILKEN